MNLIPSLVGVSKIVEDVLGRNKTAGDQQRSQTVLNEAICGELLYLKIFLFPLLDVVCPELLVEVR